MPELIRSIAGKLRAFVGNRRRAPRFKTRLEVELSLPTSGMKKSSQAEGQSLKLAGYTCDISTSGLALIVPAIRIGGNYITEGNRTLEISLKLPNGVVKIYGKPVRYTPLDEDATATGHLVGVHIESMSDEDRSHFNAHIEEQ
jgi:hypothetical protein